VPVLNARDVATKQTSAVLDVPLAEFLFFAECAESIADNHAGIIFIRREHRQERGRGERLISGDWPRPYKLLLSFGWRDTILIGFSVVLFGRSGSQLGKRIVEFAAASLFHFFHESCSIVALRIG